MAKPVGEVALGVSADIEPLRKGLSKASKNIKNFGKGIRAQEKNFAAFGAAGVTAIVGVTAAIYKSQSQVIDQLAKTSDALGITTTNMQALNHVAELSGVSSDQMAKGLQRMERGLGEAARKGGATAQALDDVGLSVHSLLNLSPDQQITKLAAALAGVENQSVKASIASDLFGRDGVKMLKVLNQLEREGLQPTVKELEMLGVALTRPDAAKVEAANDAFFKASQVVAGVGQTITVELAPYIEHVANLFTNAAKESGGFGDEIKTAIKKGFIMAGKFGNVMQGLRVAFKGVELIAVGFGAAAVSVFQLVAEAVSKLSDLVINDVNVIIKGLNKLPKVDIATIDTISDGAFMKGLRKFGDEARSKVGQVRSEMHSMAMQKMPSDKIEKFLKDVAEKSEQAAIKTADSVKKIIKPKSEEDADNDDDFSSRIERIQARYITEQELLRNHEILMADIKRGFKEGNIQTESEYFSIKEQAEKEHLEKIQRMHEEAEKNKNRFSLSAQAGALSATVKGFGQIFGVTNQSNKKMFKIQKSLALAQAAAALPSAVIQSYQRGGGFPSGLVPAGIMLGKGMAQIRNIKKTSYSGGGSSVASGGGGGGGGGGSTQAQAPAPQASNDSLLTVSGLNKGDLYDGETVRMLADKLHEHGRNGGRTAYA